jgi:hypothetical protein
LVELDRSRYKEKKEKRMAIRKSMQEEIVVSGSREEWLQKCRRALESAGFTKVVTNAKLHKIKANYKKFMTWGTIMITLVPAGNDTRITAVSTANVDNIYALFKSPNKTILSKFKESLR